VAIGDLYNSHTFHCSKRDIQKALDWYLKAHENGNKEAAYIIAKLYKTATSIENRKQICLDWYKTAYEGGDAEAAYDAGVICYNEGDFKGAMEWFVKAEQLGHSNAAVIIGEQYNNGSGVEKDPEEAVKWYKKAYLLGTCGASHRIAEYYDTIDKAEAFKWWYRSSTAHDSAIAKRRVMELKEEGYELNRRNKGNMY
jgi:TPR repeat protein